MSFHHRIGPTRTRHGPHGRDQPIIIIVKILVRFHKRLIVIIIIVGRGELIRKVRGGRRIIGEFHGNFRGVMEDGAGQ